MKKGDYVRGIVLGFGILVTWKLDNWKMLMLPGLSWLWMRFSGGIL
jgi:hypothetical protein